jgi:gamma-glutamylcyclotransferase (GGCT)/AIG2-like uncharacterized protein YtfP
VSGRVEGELFLVPPTLLAELDEFEGCPELYQRAEIELASGKRAQSYLMHGERLAGTPWIPGGRWPARG